ncbi:hypothetical protein [Flavobacterium beibuense]|uniref:Uncharacterized protein n=1 Tax=Flavobacterium beibuense TaxID=657326 RepID=A0A444WI61_9FLAO|nr:hypothetical protein [Flavobacterium beibuense]RYJ45436.1 hypothetical protein NU09_0028 [Flavobacterium beibuense]
MKTSEIAQEINRRKLLGESMEFIKQAFNVSEEKWRSCCLKAYSINLDHARKDRKKDQEKRHVGSTSVKDILKIIELNKILGNYALLLPIFSTMTDFHKLEQLKNELPTSEKTILNHVGKLTMHPKMRVLQKLGRIEKFEYFKQFGKLIDAAVLSYYRTNFISCYFTLIPLIEGIIIRWMGFQQSEVKPEFEDVRKFFKKSALRNPNPTNILFHDVYIQICDKILNEHFYRPTTNGNAHSHFNRHVASHLLIEEEFATRQNCIRLFLLLDTMTEIYFYESGEIDPRFNLGNEETEKDLAAYYNVLLQNAEKTAEQILLGSRPLDLL